MSFLVDDPLYHLAIGLFLLPDQFLLFQFDHLVILVDGPEGVLLLLCGLPFLEFGQLGLLFPLLPEHFLLLQGHDLLLLLLPPLQLLLDGQDGVAFLDLFLLLLTLLALLVLLLQDIPAVQLGKEDLFWIDAAVPSYWSCIRFCF